LGDAEHDELGDGYALDEQEGTVSAEHAERAFRLACPGKTRVAALIS
jgi:hypothetical protein